jgi:Holliday junction DNA helicase RuvA
LSALSPDEVADSIIALDKLNLSRADGVGPKLAARIINELKDKSIIVPSSEIKPSQLTSSSFNSTFEDAISAMVNLGYSRVEAHKAATLVGAENASDITLDQLISSSLRELGS